MTPEQRIRKTECAKLRFQGIDACNGVVMSSVLTEEDRVEILAHIAAFAETRLEQCLANPVQAADAVADAAVVVADSGDPLVVPEPVEDDGEDLSFLY